MVIKEMLLWHDGKVFIDFITIIYNLYLIYFYLFIYLNLIEAENRLHIIIDILAYIPAKDIQISFMNNRDVNDNLND